MNTTIDLPNFIDPLPLKLMRIQMRFGSPVSGDSLSISVSASDPLPTDDLIVGGSLGDSSWHYIDVEIRPNPDSEQIIIYGGSGPSLYEVEIDTVSLPEPATLGLVLMGGLAILRRRR